MVVLEPEPEPESEPKPGSEPEPEPEPGPARALRPAALLLGQVTHTFLCRYSASSRALVGEMKISPPQQQGWQPTPRQALHAELQGLGVGQLRRRAVDSGLQEDTVDSALDVRAACCRRRCW